MSICCSDIMHHFQHSLAYIYESIYSHGFIFLLLSWFLNFSLAGPVNVPQGTTISLRTVFQGKNHKNQGGKKITKNKQNKNKKAKIHETHFSNSTFKMLATKGKVFLEKRRTTLKLISKHVKE